MSISFSDAVQTLLSGNELSWGKFGDFKAGKIQLASPGARRLLQFLVSCDQTKVANANEDLFDGLIAAWNNTSLDPATNAKLAHAKAETGTWRLVRLESAGFGGLNLVDGPNFVLALNGENWCLEGQNGSGKTSIASAIIWTLTGCRCRDQDGIIVDDGRRIPVFNDSGVQIGDWPPTVSYPASPQKLSGTAEAWVRLTFQNQNGDTAEAFRRLIAPARAEPKFASKVDPALLSAPQLIETGLLMPARLARIGFGERSQSIYEAVKLLTGLDQLADIGEGAANFAHKAKRFLKYGIDNGSSALEARIDLSLKRAAEEAAKAAFDFRIAAKREDNEYSNELRELASSASARAGAHLSILASEVASDLDTSKPADRLTIRNAVSAARGILQRGVKGIAAFDAWAALKAAHTDAGFRRLPATLAEVKARLEEAITWDKRQAEDRKLRLKALASQFFVASGHPHEDADCPLCENKLSGTKRNALAAELAELKKASVTAERKLTDVCAELEKEIRDVIPQALNMHFAMLTQMQPRVTFEAAAAAIFAQEASFSTVLTGMASFATETARALAANLPVFDYKKRESSADEPTAAMSLRSYVKNVERMAALVEWWAGNRQHFIDSWNMLKGVPGAEKTFPANSLEGKLASLEAALDKATPLDDLAKALGDAAKEAEKWLTIHKQQLVREAIADALEPLKDLRTLVATETASSISALSGRIKSILDRIHFKERLSFEDAALNKKSVQVSGSFDYGIRIEASTVANSSWLRAILWAFVLALREQTIEALGANPLPLVVLDDPQVTFDPRNKRKWAEEIARLANADPATPNAMQLLVITHERQFFQFLVNLEGLTGQQGIVVRLNAVSKVATVVNGSSLAHSYAEAKHRADDRLGYDYIRDIRTYCEDLLKIMLRAEGPSVCDMTLGDLAKLLKELRDGSISPFNRPSFEKLLKTISGGGGKPMKIINESHHKFDGTIGLAEATDVKAFWESALQSQIHTCFKVYAEYEAYSGEPRLFPWMDNVIQLPAGNAAEVRKLSLAHTGFAAAAKSDGRAGDGLITIKELTQSAKITLHNHDVYQLTAGTLDPVATIGDVIIVSNYAKVHPRSLIVTAFGDQLLARRYNESDVHPHIAVLTGQAVDPYALAQPVIAPKEKLAHRKIVGTLFASSRLPAPPKEENSEFATLSDFAVVRRLMQDARLFKVEGRSAEPIALEGQFIMTQPVTLSAMSLGELDGRLVIAVDANGARYFKRFRRRGPIIVLESLNPDGIAPAEILTLDGELGIPRLTGLLEVVGILFELPN
ncbi:AAA family ATPase [Bradyrhizobium sp. SZCCHNR1098]|uniref:ATP-binding protein n=1 Tax=Bradyrhizobium sp. SZCCHNR1098 TaxID=3057370 RepID=UPI002915DE8C|nr:AAA family ATPase [Bradyrhizobium sp. SZCCHNR1098]